MTLGSSGAASAGFAASAVGLGASAGAGVSAASAAVANRRLPSTAASLIPFRSIMMLLAATLKPPAADLVELALGPHVIEPLCPIRFAPLQNFQLAGLPCRFHRFQPFLFQPSPCLGDRIGRAAHAVRHPLHEVVPKERLIGGQAFLRALEIGLHVFERRLLEADADHLGVIDRAL